MSNTFDITVQAGFHSLPWGVPGLPWIQKAKVLSDPKCGEILGVHMIGPRAADLIAQAVAGMTYEVTDEDMAMVSYAHPTFAEAMKEAYLQASGRGALNI